MTDEQTRKVKHELREVRGRCSDCAHFGGIKRSSASETCRKCFRDPKRDAWSSRAELKKEANCAN